MAPNDFYLKGGAPQLENAAYILFNFEQEGVKRQHFFKNGKFLDFVSIAVFSDTIKYPDF